MEGFPYGKGDKKYPSPVYELIHTEVPAKAIINEALELAKKFDDEQSPAFINGILNKIARDHNLLG